MHSSPEFLLYIQELRSHPVAPGFPAKKELAPAVAAADEGEAKEIEGLRLPKSASFTVGRCEATKFDQTSPLGV